MPELSGKAFTEAYHDAAEAATHASSRRLTLNQVVSVIDNVSAEEYGPKQGEDCVLHWAWREEDLEHGPHQECHQASKQHGTKEAASRQLPLLQYIIRLVGWHKHGSVSLSLSAHNEAIDTQQSKSYCSIFVIRTMKAMTAALLSSYS